MAPSDAIEHPWLQKKALHDSAAGATSSLPTSKTINLWMVHGKWYDLSSYISKHPGGSFWLENTKGMDVTDLVETHHFNTGQVQAILDPLYVGDGPVDYKGFFEFQKDGLYLTLKRRVSAALASPTVNSNATPLFKNQCAAVLAAHLVLFVGTALTGSYWLAVATGVTISSLHGIGHNFLHQRDNLWMYVAMFGGWKVPLNRVSHAISHHPRPNTEWDLEILGLEPWLYNMVDRPANSPLVAIYGPLLCCSGHLLDVVLMWKRLLLGTQQFKPEYLSNFGQLLFLCYCAGVFHGAALFAIMFLVFGAIDSYAGYPLHHTESAWTVGDPAHERKTDLAEHIIATTVDYDTGQMGFWTNMLCYELMPNHALHHLFPTLDCSRFPVVRPIVEQTLKEFNVQQKVIPMPHIYFGMWPAWLRGTTWFTTWSSSTNGKRE